MSASPVVFLVHRPALRSALSAVEPHAGKASRDFPFLGRVRWTLDVAEQVLLVWAGDMATCAAARVPVTELDPFGEQQLVQWDTTTGVLAKVLAVFRVSSTREDPDDVLRLELAGRQLHVTEAGGLLPGEHLKVPTIAVPDSPEEDKTPDVPRLLAPFLGAPASTFGTAAVAAKDLLKFRSSVRSYGGVMETILVDDPFPRLLVRAHQEPNFIGLVYRVDGRGDDARNEQERAEAEQARADWLVDLEPLRRPEQVRVPAAVEEDLLDQAREVLAAGGQLRLKVVGRVERDPDKDRADDVTIAFDLDDEEES